ncbi:MAG: VWA domain-containing protein [Taibaiella sp.]|nr:VWA domain-containing protein [Taibaiella sp.]
MDEYISFEQIPFGSDNFADNPEPRCPCVLLLDTSISMGGMPIMQLNEGVRTFKQELMLDALATKRVEVAIVTFGPVTVEDEFHTVPNFHPRELETTGDTPLGAAINTGIDLVARRKKEYKDAGIAYYKPWIILITDGAPTDEWAKAAMRVKEGEASKSFAFFAIGVEGANMDILQQISSRAPLKLKGLMFREFFMWLSASMKMVSSKNPGTAVNLLPPSGWSEL